METKLWVKFLFMLATAVVPCVSEAAATDSDGPSTSEPADDGVHAQVLLVVGAPGAPEYADLFAQWQAKWSDLADRGGIELTVIEPAEDAPAEGEDAPSAGEDAPADGGGDSEIDVSTGSTPPPELIQRERLRMALDEAANASSVPLWFVYIGHGTFDGRTARMNLSGPDVSAEELKSWLDDFSRPLAFIDCSACSAPFLAQLAAPDRIVVTATRSGNEHQFARFGGAFVQAFHNDTSDLDKDGQTSLLEAYIFASKTTQAKYREQGLLATEHALLDDNGDGRGTPAEWFEGVIVLREVEGDATADGTLAHQWHLLPTASERSLSPQDIDRRSELEQQLTQLRRRRDALAEDEYVAQLEAILVPLARLYAEQ